MNLSTDQEARFTAIVNCFGDAFAQDRSDDRMHEWLAIIRNEMVDDWVVPLAHPDLIDQLNFIDRLLDAIIDRRNATTQIIAANLQHLLAKHLH